MKIEIISVAINIGIHVKCGYKQTLVLEISHKLSFKVKNVLLHIGPVLLHIGPQQTRIQIRPVTGKSWRRWRSRGRGSNASHQYIPCDLNQYCSCYMWMGIRCNTHPGIFHQFGIFQPQLGIQIN